MYCSPSLFQTGRQGQRKFEYLKAVCIVYMFSVVLVTLGSQRHLLIIFSDSLFSEGE